MIILDIETSALSPEQLAPLLPTFEANKTLKDLEKVAADLQKKQLEWMDECALHANRGYVLAAGLIMNGETVILEGNEKFIITTIWDIIRASEDKVVGHYIKGFDLPFLIRRSWIIGVKVPNLMNGRYLSNRFFDTMELWAAGTRDTISLDNLAKAFGLPGKNGDGAGFSFLYKDLETKQVAIDYLKNDLLLVQQISERMGL